MRRGTLKDRCEAKSGRVREGATLVKSDDYGQPVIRVARSDDVDIAVSVAVRAFCNNPMTNACWGRDEHARERGLRFVFQALLPALKNALVVACVDDTVVGVLGMAQPGTCRELSLSPSLRALAAMSGRNPLSTYRFVQWMGVYERVHPRNVHWHLGPVAVEPALQGRGIGSALLQRYVESVDTAKGISYLESDDATNVRLYQHFGYQITHSQDILHVRNWFMTRPAAETAGDGEPTEARKTGQRR